MNDSSNICVMYAIEEAKWAVVDSNTHDGHIVCIEHAMRPTNALPLYIHNQKKNSIK